MKRVTRENAIIALKKEIKCRNNTYCTWSEDCDGCSYATNEQDLLDALEMAIEVLNIPARPKGKWIAHKIELPDKEILNYTCSVCGRKLVGYSTETLKDAPYCHCGADMRESE